MHLLSTESVFSVAWAYAKWLSKKYLLYPSLTQRNKIEASLLMSFYSPTPRERRDVEINE